MNSRYYDLVGEKASVIKNPNEEIPLTRKQRRELAKHEEKRKEKVIKQQKQIAKRLGFSK